MGSRSARDAPLVLAVPPMVGQASSPLIGAHVPALIGAAADAGFDGVAVCTGHPAWGVADEAAAREFFDHAEWRLPVMTSEVIGVELAGRPASREVTEANARMLDLSARTGAASVNVITLAEELPSLTEAGVRLAALCDLAADRGLKVNFECLPWTAVPDVTTAVRLIEATDRDNLGLCVDTWHWFRRAGGPDLDALRALPPDRIHVLQLNDAPVRPGDDLVAETVTERLLPGAGAIDIAGVLDILDELGATPVVVTEIFSDALVALGHAENARQQHDTARAVLADPIPERGA
jgi:sugar phosphate isomerase/epimerase